MIEDLDLKTLQVFKLMMEEKSQTKVAQKLGKDQSTVSYYLAKLKDISGDVLFERISNELHPTPRARELYRMVTKVFGLIENEFDKDSMFQFDADQRTYRLLVSDYFSRVIAPTLFDELSTLSSKINLELDILPNFNNSAMQKSFSAQVSLGLANLEYDMVVCEQTNTYDFSHIKQQKIFEDELVLIRNSQNVKLLGSVIDDGDVSVETLMIQKNNGSSRLNSYPALVDIVKRTLFQAYVPRRLIYGDSDLEVIGYQDQSRFDVYQLWHVNYDKDDGHKWLRRFVQNQCRDLMM